MVNFLFLLILLTHFASSNLLACTAFTLNSLENGTIVGQSYDWFWYHGHGAAIENPRGIQRSGMRKGGGVPAVWTSKYGSVTLTQFGQGFPISGMNEKGLTVVLLESAAEFKSKDKSKPYINESQFAQYALDRFASVEEVVNGIGNFRIKQAHTGVHYLVVDASGDTAAIDYSNGAPVIRRSNLSHPPVLTNSSYDTCRTALKGPSLERLPVAPPLRTSCERFQIATDLISLVPKANHSVPFAFSVLDHVKQNGTVYDTLFPDTQWQVAFDASHGKVHFRTRGSQDIKIIDLKELTFNKPQVLDMAALGSGVINQNFKPYSSKFNRDLIDQNWILMSGKLRDKGFKHSDDEIGINFPALPSAP